MSINKEDINKAIEWLFGIKNPLVKLYYFIFCSVLMSMAIVGFSLLIDTPLIMDSYYIGSIMILMIGIIGHLGFTQLKEGYFSIATVILLIGFIYPILVSISISFVLLMVIFQTILSVVETIKHQSKIW